MPGAFVGINLHLGPVPDLSMIGKLLENLAGGDIPIYHIWTLWEWACSSFGTGDEHSLALPPEIAISMDLTMIH